jgi:putative transposase
MLLSMSRLLAIENPHCQSYPSDLSDAEWLILKPLLPTPKGFGHPVEVDLREILNGIFCVQRTGCQWEMLPHDLSPYTTVYGYFQKSQRKGIWQKIHDQVRHQLQQDLGRDEDSTVAISRRLDAESQGDTRKERVSPILNR